ncbi:hypothetical protein [Allokutzneria sp. NRRL B-24872]|uniref:hypothetical protein n=1 Tax=Allokutzneria sp. NRRL B-24872 TaxID=1137961 RepID=UPI000A3C8BB3|nr:hypothetical protein [Allokutzneria sp. NRRL B-24872]
MEPATTVRLLGAGAFGLLVGWFVCVLNRRRSADVRLSLIGGGAVLALFLTGTDLFGAHGIGLFAGCLVVLVLLVGRSENFTIDRLVDERLPNGADRGAMGARQHDGPRR